MIFSHKWLQEYFEDTLPEPKELAELLTFHSFEIEGVNGDLIDIDILPNRSHDCLCYQGIAKEISVLTGLKTCLPAGRLQEKVEEKTETKEGFKTADFVSLQVEDSFLVPRATKRLVRNVKIGPSPDWLKEKLKSIGQKSINNVVDITNFVMWETGQPVHAFDFDKISGDSYLKPVAGQRKKIIIRKAQAGEQIKTLDAHEFILSEEDLVISDEEKALDIAGIKGGAVSGIDENTQNLLLSVCNFNQANIRKTSRSLGLRTDASERFEKGITPIKVMEAMEKMSNLIKEIAGGELSEDILDVYPRQSAVYKVGVSVAEINSLLGLNLKEEEIEKIFQRLNFKFEKIKAIENVLKLAPDFVGVPYKLGASVSFDAPREFDCASFTAYLFAQSGVAIPRVSVDQYVFGNPVSKSDLQAGDLIFFNSGKGKIHNKTVDFLKGTDVPEGVDHVALYLGDGKMIHASKKESVNGEVNLRKIDEYHLKDKIIGYRRVFDNQDPKLSIGQERFVVNVPDERLDIRIKEDLIEEVGRIYGYKNIRAQIPNKIFEPKINKTFYYINKIKKILIENGFSEVYNYTFCDKGKVEVLKPLASNLGFLRENLSDGIKKSLELNLKNAPVLGLEEIKIFEIGKVYPSLDGEYNALAIGVTSTKKKQVSINARNEAIQKVLAILEKEFDLALRVPSEGLFEINLDKIIEKLPEPKNYDDCFAELNVSEKKYQQISPYPFVLRDIAVWVPNENNADDLLTLIKENAGDLLVQTKLFDTYAPENEARTSYAFSMVFQSQEKTLTDEEVNKIMEKINQEIEFKKGWEVR